MHRIAAQPDFSSSQPLRHREAALDPENKYLSHSFVESPDMKNIYDGVVSLDTNAKRSSRCPNVSAL